MSKTQEIVNTKLEESYNHIKPYIKECPELLTMCSICEKWYGEDHDYDECKGYPCFRFWLAYKYLEWESNYE